MRLARPQINSTPLPSTILGSRLAERRWSNFARALLLSLALHALVLSLQFGDADNGLPWFGIQEGAKIASIPLLNAVLHGPEAVEKLPPEQTAQTDVGSSGQHAAASRVQEPPPPNPPSAALTTHITKLETRPTEAAEQNPAADVAVLSTDRPSTWNRPLQQAPGETPNPQQGLPPTEEAPVLEQKTVDEPARIEAEQAAREASARERELALENKRAEEQAHLEAMRAEQAAVAARLTEEAALAQQAEALARKREADKLAAEQAAKEQARIEAEKAAQASAAREQELVLEKKRAAEQARLEAVKMEQAAAARAREAEAALARQAEAEALARKREADKLAAEKAAKVAAEKISAEQQSRLANTPAGNPDGGKESGNGPGAGKGSELARRALDAIRGGQMGLPGIESTEPARPRRGSILGKDPKDIQLAFYGESWRLKVESIGSLNYPTLSKNLTYDPLVVTVSINSDGTLAGVRIVKSSGHKDMDEAVLRIVTMSAPFAQFPPAMKRLYDVVDITRTWVFLQYRPEIASQ